MYNRLKLLKDYSGKNIVYTDMFLFCLGFDTVPVITISHLLSNVYVRFLFQFIYQLFPYDCI